MLKYLLEKSAALVSETIDAVKDEFEGIPEAIEKGWNEGFKSEDEATKSTSEVGEDISKEKEARIKELADEVDAELNKDEDKPRVFGNNS